MKSQIIITLLVLFGTLGLNAQILLTCAGSNTDAKVSFISKSGQDITLKIDWNEGSTFASSNLAINNGTCTNCPYVGGPHDKSKEWTIHQTDSNNPVSIAWATSGTINYCGDSTTINITTEFTGCWGDIPYMSDPANWELVYNWSTCNDQDGFRVLMCNGNQNYVFEWRQFPSNPLFCRYNTGDGWVTSSGTNEEFQAGKAALIKIFEERNLNYSGCPAPPTCN